MKKVTTRRMNGQKFARIIYESKNSDGTTTDTATWYPVENLRWLARNTYWFFAL